MHRGLSSVMMNYARSISDEKKVKTIVKGNKSGEITGSSDDMQEKLIYKCGLKRRQVWDTNSMSWYTKVYYVDGSLYNPVLFHDGKIDKKSIKLSDGSLGHVYNVKNKWFDRMGMPIDKPNNLVTRDKKDGE